MATVVHIWLLACRGGNALPALIWCWLVYKQGGLGPLVKLARLYLDWPDYSRPLSVLWLEEENTDKGKVPSKHSWIKIFDTHYVEWVCSWWLQSLVLATMLSNLAPILHSSLMPIRLCQENLTFGKKRVPMILACLMNKPAVQAAGADPSRCNSNNKQNPPIQQNWQNF